MHLIVRKPYLEKIKSHLHVVSKEFHNDTILLKANRDSLVLFLSSANANSHVRLELILNAHLDIKIPGEALINARVLADLMSKLDLSKDLEIYRADRNYLQFFSGSYECDLVLLNGDHVKDIDISKEILGMDPVIIPYTVIKEAYFRLKDFCRSFDSSLVINPILTNIHFRKDLDSPCLEVWASDAYRAICGEFRTGITSAFRLNLHPSTVALMIGIYSKHDSINLYIMESEEYLICNREGCTIKTKVSGADYPSFIGWFNMPKTLDFTVSKRELLGVIDRNLLLPDKDLQLTLYKVDRDSLLVEYKNSEKGKCRELIEIKGNKNQKAEFYLNNLLLKGLIKPIESEEILFKVYDSLKPIVLLPKGASNFKQFIMPSKNV